MCNPFNRRSQTMAGMVEVGIALIGLTIAIYQFWTAIEPLVR